ncbi:hypothetical protein KR059_011703 [Drosophila kikkawai]|nr:uncharacterized protein LOC108071836 [Drosophila kikkawai]KAH8303471.1 hypothetical protein KR059_011703 [Drosophila kikkawai]
MTQKPIQLNDVPTVRILMLGDKGVGKTSVTNLMACTVDTPTVASRSVSHPYYNIQVRLHEYPNTAELPPTPTWTSHSSSEYLDKTEFPRRMPLTSDILYFVEFIDMNSPCSMQRLQRRAMFQKIDGIVLVYNLQDPRSQDNLHDYLYEPLRQICKRRHGRRHSILKTNHVPIVVVATRLDKLIHLPLRRCSIAQQLNAEEILVNGQDPKSFADKSNNHNKLCGFLNRVVEFKERKPNAQPSPF